MTSTPPTSKGCCGLAERQHNSLPLMWRMTTFSSSMEASPSHATHSMHHGQAIHAKFARHNEAAIHEFQIVSAFLGAVVAVVAAAVVAVVVVVVAAAV